MALSTWVEGVGARLRRLRGWSTNQSSAGSASRPRPAVEPLEGRTLMSTVVAPADLNDQIAEAVAVTIGAKVSGSPVIDSGTDVDLFKFTEKAGQRVGFNVDKAA